MKLRREEEDEEEIAKIFHLQLMAIIFQALPETVGMEDPDLQEAEIVGSVVEYLNLPCMGKNGGKNEEIQVLVTKNCLKDQTKII